MSLLRRTRSELAGAWRSVRYDLGRHPAEPPAGGPDMTSTGMNTFGGHIPDDSGPVPHARPPRRAAAVTAFGVLTVLGAAGAYLGVVNGLGSLLNETPAAADTFPPPPSATATFAPNAGIGRGPAPRRAIPVTTGVPPAAASSSVPARNLSPIRTTKPTNPECTCSRSPVGQPPVPTPTAPATPPTPTTSATSPEPSDSASPDPSATSATPSDSAEPSDTPQGRHHRRHR